MHGAQVQTRLSPASQALGSCLPSVLRGALASPALGTLTSRLTRPGFSLVPLLRGIFAVSADVAERDFSTTTLRADSQCVLGPPVSAAKTPFLLFALVEAHV